MYSRQQATAGCSPVKLGFFTNSFQPTSNGLQPNSNGLQPNSNGLQPNSNGLEPNSDGLQPTSDGLHLRKLGLLSWKHNNTCSVLPSEWVKTSMLSPHFRCTDKDMVSNGFGFVVWWGWSCYVDMCWSSLSFSETKYTKIPTHPSCSSCKVLQKLFGQEDIAWQFSHHIHLAGELRTVFQSNSGSSALSHPIKSKVLIDFLLQVRLQHDHWVTEEAIIDGEPPISEHPNESCLQAVLTSFQAILLLSDPAVENSGTALKKMVRSWLSVRCIYCSCHLSFWRLQTSKEKQSSHGLPALQVDLKTLRWTTSQKMVRWDSRWVKLCKQSLKGLVVWKDYVKSLVGSPSFYLVALEQS